MTTHKAKEPVTVLGTTLMEIKVESIQGDTEKGLEMTQGR